MNGEDISPPSVPDNLMSKKPRLVVLKISTKNISNHYLGNLRNRCTWSVYLMDADSLACACGILDLVIPEQKIGNLKLLLKGVLRQFHFGDVEGSDNGGFSWYAKLRNHLKVAFRKKFIHLLLSNKNLIQNGFFDSNQLP